MDFRVGDVVQLKSGGPQMTVQSVGPAAVVVVWFNEEGGKFTLDSASFPKDAVEKA